MAEASSRDLYQIRYADDNGWRPERLKFNGVFWDYDPEVDMYRSRRKLAFGHPVLPRTLDWFLSYDEVECWGTARPAAEMNGAE